jgi:hypothetical protein
MVPSMAPEMAPRMTSLEPHLCWVSSLAGRLAWCWWTESPMGQLRAPETSLEPDLCWGSSSDGHYLSWAGCLAVRLASCLAGRLAARWAQ